MRALPVVMTVVFLHGAVTGQAVMQDGWPTVDNPYTKVFSMADVEGDGCMELFGFISVSADMWAYGCDGTELTAVDGFGAPDIPWPPLDTYKNVLYFGDLDGDDMLEYVFTHSGESHWLFAVEFDGSPVPGWPIVVGDGFDGIGDFAVVDVTGDGIDEVVVFDYWNFLWSRIWVYDGSGQVIPGWPQQVDDLAAGLAVGDLEFDGDVEVVVSTSNPWDPFDGPYPIYVFEADGTLRDGWPVTPSVGPGTLLNVQIADLDGDYQCEIVGSGMGADDGQGWVGYILSYTGDVLVGPVYDEYLNVTAIGNFDLDDHLEVAFPARSFGIWDLEDGPLAIFPSGGEYEYFAKVTVADVDGDGVSELAAMSSVPRAVHLFNASFEELEGWPKLIDPASISSREMTVLDDIDGDGDIELIFNELLHYEAWDIPNPSGQPLRVDWGHWSHDPGRTNNYHHGRPPGPRFLRGDGNGDGEVNVADVVVQLLYVFGFDPDHECPARLDFDANAEVDLSDPIQGLTYQFLLGPAPAAPFPYCAEQVGEPLSCEWMPCP